MARKEVSQRWYVLATVMIGTFMAALDASIVNVSVPVMRGYFDVSVGDIGWVITAYMIAFAVFMPLTSWLRDRLGGKRLYFWALAVFTLGSVLCGAAPTFSTLIAARILQALGAGALTPSAMALVADVFKPSERGRAFGYWGLGVIVGPALGPTLGGILTEEFGWRSIFYVNLPVGLVGLWAAAKYLPRSEAHHLKKHPLDLAGFFLLTVFLVLFLFGVSSFETTGPGGQVPTWIWTTLGLSILAFAAFLSVERRRKQGVIDLSLFKIPAFNAAALLTFARSLALYGGVFMLPLLLQGALHYGETKTGLIMLPGAVLLGILMPLSGKWADAKGARVLAIIGVALVSLSLVGIGFFRTEYAIFDISLALLLRGFGLGLLVTPVSAASVNSVPHAQVGMASSISSLLQQVGGAVGIAAAASFYQIWLTTTHGGLAPGEVGALRATFVVGGLLMALGAIPALRLPSTSTPTREMESLVPLE